MKCFIHCISSYASCARCAGGSAQDESKRHVSYLSRAGWQRCYAKTGSNDDSVYSETLLLGDCKVRLPSALD